MVLFFWGYMSLEEAWEDLGEVRREFRESRHLSRIAKTTLWLVQRPFNRIVSLNSSLVQAPQGEISDMQSHFGAAKEAIQEGSSVFMEAIGADFNNTAEHVAGVAGMYATSLANGEIEFEGMNLPETIASVAHKLAAISTYLEEARECSEAMVGRIGSSRAALDEVSSKSGPLMQAEEAAENYRRAFREYL